MRKVILSLSVALGGLGGGTAHAQDLGADQKTVAPLAEAPSTEATAGSEPEIIITGSRLRNEAVQDAPLAVSVISAAQIAQLHAPDIRALSATVPNLYVNQAATNSGLPTLSLRGFNSVSSDISFEPGIATYIDGVYQPIASGSLLDLFDVERVEVLRGPQSTLLGKNAAAGAVMMTRARPGEDFTGRAQLDYGSFDMVQVQGMVNVPIVPGRLSSRVFTSLRRRDDYVTNVEVPGGDLGGQRLGAVRAALRFTPTAELEYYLSGEYLWDNSAQSGVRNLSGPTTLNCTLFGYCAPDAGLREITRAGYLENQETDDYNLTGRGDWNAGPVTIASITGWRKYRAIANVDLDATPLPNLQAENSPTWMRLFSQELRIASEEGGGLDLGGRLSWILGAYFNHSNARNVLPTRALNVLRTGQQQVVRDSYALFGHTSFDLLDSLSVSLGLRRSWDSVTHRFAPAQVGPTPAPYAVEEEADFANTSIEAGAQYNIDRTKMLYVRYAEGYRGGGFIGIPATVQGARGYNPETSRAYELGLKTEWWQRRFTFNVALYHVKFNDLQRASVVVGPNNTFIQTISNAAEATTEGVEVEAILRPVDGLTMRSSLGYLNADYIRFTSINAANGQVIDLSNTPFAFAPEYTASGAIEYRFDLFEPGFIFDGLTLSGRANYVSRLSVSNALARVGNQPGYALLDGSATLISDSGGYELSFFVQNITNRDYKVFANSLGAIGDFAYFGMPRTFGVSLGVRF